MKSITVSLLLLYFTILVASKEVYYELTISYFDGAPDGVPFKILGINGQFPGPTIRAAKYDILTIKVTNLIQDFQSTTIHWHGIEQFLTPFEDGPRMITQCDIPYNSSFTYQFQANQTGTYWYHSHHTSQAAEGLWGAMIIDNTPEVHQYDGEFVLSLQDWFHLPAHDLFEWYHNASLSRGGLPYPDSSLINGEGYYPCYYANKKNMSCNPSYEQRYKLLEVERGKTYRFRIINPATILLYQFLIDGHKLEVIETDGVDTIRTAGVDTAFVSTGTRVSFLVKMDGDLDQYWIRSYANIFPMKLDYPNINPYPEAMYENLLARAVLRYKDSPVTTNTNKKPSINKDAVQGRPETHDRTLIDNVVKYGYKKALDLESKLASSERVDGLQFYDDPIKLPIATPPFPTTNEMGVEDRVMLNYFDCAPISGETAPTYYNQSIIITVPDIDDNHNTFKPGFNNISFTHVDLDKPALFKALRGETLPSSLNPIVINGFGHDYVVDIIVNDYGDGGHPFHLHGHTYWVMGRGDMHEGPFVEERDRPKLKSGVRRETQAIQPSSWMVIRFRADNPGLWLFHCHMTFHFESALGLVLVEGLDVAKDIYTIPENGRQLCKLNGIELDEDIDIDPSSIATRPAASFLGLIYMGISLNNIL